MGFLLLIPFFLIRFGLLSLLDKKAIQRAGHFAPMAEKEKIAYWLYQISNIAIFIYMIFLQIRFTPSIVFFSGVMVYLAGNVLLIITMMNFSSPSETGINQKGLYSLSRNPMYVAYFVYFIGCVLLTQSPILLGFVLLFQITAHWIILAEERWCIKNFGEEYLQYMKQVRRYI